MAPIRDIKLFDKTDIVWDAIYYAYLKSSKTLFSKRGIDSRQNFGDNARAIQDCNAQLHRTFNNS